MAKHKLPGTWVLTIAEADNPPGQSIITFTSDHGLVERVERQIEGAIGVWQYEEDDDEVDFRFMFHRYVHDLQLTNTQPPTIETPFDAIVRLRAKNSFTGPDSFQGTSALDLLDASGNVTHPNFLTTQHTAVRMKLVP